MRQLNISKESRFSILVILICALALILGVSPHDKFHTLGTVLFVIGLLWMLYEMKKNKNE